MLPWCPESKNQGHIHNFQEIQQKSKMNFFQFAALSMREWPPLPPVKTGKYNPQGHRPAPDQVSDYVTSRRFPLDISTPWGLGAFCTLGCVTITIQGGQARPRPRFRLLISGTFHSLPGPAWAGGNLAE